MMTVEFPFGVKKSPETGETTFVSTRFRYTIRTTRELEKASIVGLSALLMQGQTVIALVLLVCYGLKWERPRITEDDAVNLLDQFVEAGGDTKALSEALQKAIVESGVYGQDPLKARAPIDLSQPPEGADPLGKATIQ